MPSLTAHLYTLMTSLRHVGWTECGFTSSFDHFYQHPADLSTRSDAMLKAAQVVCVLCRLFRMLNFIGTKRKNCIIVAYVNNYSKSRASFLKNVFGRFRG